jgi:hypothetical protein
MHLCRLGGRTRGVWGGRGGVSAPTHNSYSWVFTEGMVVAPEVNSWMTQLSPPADKSLHWL